MCEVQGMEAMGSEMIYLCAYGVIKRMLDDGILSREAFDRLNIKMAAEKSCKPVAE